MDISARLPLTAGIALTTAAAIAVAPVALPVHHRAPVRVATPDVALTVTPADIEAAIAAAIGHPGQALIGVVDNIVTTIDTVFTRLTDATSDPTAAASLTILKGLSVRAFAMLAENLRRGDAVLGTTSAQVGALLTSALTGSLRQVLLAGANVVNAPLSPASYTGLLTAGIAGTRLLVGNGLEAVQAMGDAGFALAGIAVDEVSFQVNNGLGGISTLLTQLGDASGSPIVEAVVKAVQGLVFTPALAVFNAGSQVAGAVLDAANAGFDTLIDGASAVVGAPAAAAAVTTLTSEEATEESADEVVAATSTEEPVEASVEKPVEAEPAEPVEKSVEPAEAEPAEASVEASVEESVEDKADEQVTDTPAESDTDAKRPAAEQESEPKTAAPATDDAA
jgi:hypothetical protein